MAAAVSILDGTLDQAQWVIQMNGFIDEDDLNFASKTPASVFRLPDAVHADDPEAYLPRHVALGPYHHFRPELYKMEICKLGEAKEVQIELQLQSKVHELVNQLKRLELRIRACFEQYLEMNGETLSWIMLIDGFFLLKLLQKRYSQRPLKLPLHIFYGKLSSEYDIVSDMLKLENQIPILVLEGVLPNNYISNLTPLLYQFCASVSPFDLPSYGPDGACFRFHPNLPEIYQQSHHLLNFLYLTVLLIPEEMVAVANTFGSTPMAMSMDTSVNFRSESSNKLGSFVNIAFIQQLKEALGLIQTLFRLLGSLTKPNSGEERSPLVPSASELEKVGVNFKSTKNGILKCRFDKTTPTLTLPSIHLDGFSRVLLRNLVAFEAISELNPPCLVSYIALMNGLLTNSKDVKILERAEIIYNHLDSDEEVVKLFIGVKNSSNSLKKTNVLKIHLEDETDLVNGSEFIEEIKCNYEKGLKGMVEEINKYYESCWRIKMKKFVNKYVSPVFKILAILVIIFLIVLVMARLICSFFSCPGKIFKTSIAADVISLRMFD